MKRFFTPLMAFLLLSISNTSLAQDSIILKGYRIEDEDTLTVVLRLGKHDSLLKGSATYLYKHSKYYKIYNVSGKLLSNDSLLLFDRSLEDKLTPSPGCNTYGNYYLKSSYDNPLVTGLWTEPVNPGLRDRQSAKLMLTKENGSLSEKLLDSLLFLQSVKERNDSVIQTVKTASRSITVEIYDNAVVDNDILTIQLNDAIVKKNLLVSSKPEQLTIHIDSKNKKNVLRFVAENEGRIPPNTATIKIYTDEGSYLISVAASYRYNGVVVFELKDE